MYVHTIQTSPYGTVKYLLLCAVLYIFLSVDEANQHARFTDLTYSSRHFFLTKQTILYRVGGTGLLLHLEMVELFVLMSL